MNDMKTVFPFGNEVSTLTVTGAELLEALEAATYSTPEAIGAFPQVAGIEFTIDTTVAYENGEQYEGSTYYAPAKPGSRVTIATVGGQPFDPAALYVIATNDFTAAGGDTYAAFQYANATTGYKTGLSLEDALVEYVDQVLGGVVPAAQYAEPQGRIIIK
jgi:2',3'-cyclic-nucleotide 2'-phosphodiesterase (5'-nucleotidase family)